MNFIDFDNASMDLGGGGGVIPPTDTVRRQIIYQGTTKKETFFGSFKFKFKFIKCDIIKNGWKIQYLLSLFKDYLFLGIFSFEIYFIHSKFVQLYIFFHLGLRKNILDPFCGPNIEKGKF